MKCTSILEKNCETDFGEFEAYCPSVFLYQAYLAYT